MTDIQNILFNNRNVTIKCNNIDITNIIVKIFKTVESCISIEQLDASWIFALNAFNHLSFKYKSSEIIIINNDNYYININKYDSFFTLYKGYYMAKKFQLLNK